MRGGDNRAVIMVRCARKIGRQREGDSERQSDRCDGKCVGEGNGGGGMIGAG